MSHAATIVPFGKQASISGKIRSDVQRPSQAGAMESWVKSSVISGSYQMLPILGQYVSKLEASG
jgi:hypothetical protein